MKSTLYSVVLLVVLVCLFIGCKKSGDTATPPPFAFYGNDHFELDGTNVFITELDYTSAANNPPVTISVSGLPAGITADIAVSSGNPKMGSACGLTSFPTL